MAVLPLQTERLTLRVMHPGDAAILAAYRNDPVIARFQDWHLPFTIGDAERMLAGQADATDLLPDDWVQIAIELRDGPDGRPVVVGDVAVGMRGDGIAMLGYTLAPGWHGRGFASEAAEAIVDAVLDDTPVHRIVATLDPANFASMRVIEPLGFRFEGIARASEPIRGEWLDDMRFALLREDRRAWRTRPRERPAHVELVEITSDLLTTVQAMETFRFQRQFVAPVDRSLAQALVPPPYGGEPVVPWYRAILADGVVAGFVMMAEPTGAQPVPYLWRLLVDRAHQGRGIGATVIGLLADRSRAAGHTAMDVSWVDAPGGPRPFYERLGFVPTGVIDDAGEIEARLAL